MNTPDTTGHDCADLRFVLVETSRPGNIGAAARAMKTMGFASLFLVNPRFPDALLNEEAVAFASGAQDVLANARVVSSIDEALAGCRLTAAVSARLREFSPPVVAPRGFAQECAERTGDAVALVFGNERFGLPNHIVERCNQLINIPTNPDYASLNLAQAVQVLAYECRIARLGESPDAVDGVPPQQTGIGFRGEPAEMAEIEGMYGHLEQALTAIGFLNPDNPKKLMPRLRRLFARAGLEREEVNILRGIARRILEAVERR